MTDDVVAMINAILNGEDNFILLLQRPQLDRIRDEILALREMRDAHVRILSAKLDDDEENMRRWIAKARAEALEEAARLCDRIGLDGFASDGAAAIRALREKH